MLSEQRALWIWGMLSENGATKHPSCHWILNTHLEFSRFQSQNYQKYSCPQDFSGWQHSLSPVYKIKPPTPLLALTWAAAPRLTSVLVSWKGVSKRGPAREGVAQNMAPERQSGRARHLLTRDRRPLGQETFSRLLFCFAEGHILMAAQPMDSGAKTDHLQSLGMGHQPTPLPKEAVSKCHILSCFRKTNVATHALLAGQKSYNCILLKAMLIWI